MSKKYDFLNLATTTSPFVGRLHEAAARVIDSGRFLGGPEIEAFERELAQYLSAPYAIGVSNGLDAIRLIFRAYMQLGRLAPGDEVIIPANTYIASVLPIVELGLRPVLAPVSLRDFNLDFERLEEFITPKTRAVMPVHLYGTSAWNEKACADLHSRGILIIEDNAQAVGATAPSAGLHESRMTGALGDAAAISFYPTKNLGALGDGGAVVTHDDELAQTVRALANYGADRRYHNIYCGYNNRLDEIQAAFLRVKLPELDKNNAFRHQAALAYCREINNPLIALPEIFNDRRQIWHQFVVRSPKRDELQNYLIENGVGCDIHYAVPPHLQPCFKGVFTDRSLKEAEELANSILSLPIANISVEDAKEIAEITNGFKG